MSNKVKVTIMEFERGWGSRVDEVREFDTWEAAEAFATKFNAANDQDEVPDWYMVAMLPERPR